MTISSEGKLAELIFQSTTLRLLLLQLLLLLALEAILPLVSTICVFHHSVVVCLLWKKRRRSLLWKNLWNFHIIASENLSSTISKLSSSWGHRHRILLHLHLLLSDLWLNMGFREFSCLLCLTLGLLSLQFLMRHRLRIRLLWLQLLLHLHRLLLYLLFH